MADDPQMWAVALSSGTVRRVFAEKMPLTTNRQAFAEYSFLFEQLPNFRRKIKAILYCSPSGIRRKVFFIDFDV